ncbi:MAG TPA: hypothetical protein VK497_01270 [Candidatus Saccharimonadales bacterium]|nr:hypothetical protein [Candidatus Saccharimonadales bacterium]
MEFEQKPPTSDEDRRLAEAKKLTLQPLHGDLAPEDEPDAAVVARHLTQGALANTPNDTEQASVPVRPSTGLLDHTDEPQATKQSKKVILVITALVVAGTILTTIVLSL